MSHDTFCSISLSGFLFGYYGGKQPANGEDDSHPHGDGNSHHPSEICLDLASNLTQLSSKILSQCLLSLDKLFSQPFLPSLKLICPVSM